MRFADYHAPKLTDDEARDLARLARRGDAAARERLILLGAGVVHHRSALRRYRRLGRWLPLEDALQEGWLAMVRAADGYDPDRRMPFRKYAWMMLCNHTAHLLEAFVAKRRGSMPARLGDADDYDLLGQLPARDADPWRHADLRMDLAVLLRRVPDRERAAMCLHYGLDGEGGRGLGEVGAILGVSYRTAWQLKERAFGRMREGA